jgi:hypothetical protein
MLGSERSTPSEKYVEEGVVRNVVEISGISVPNTVLVGTS